MSYSLAYESDVGALSSSLLGHVHQADLVSKMGRPDLVTMTENLIGLMRFPSKALTLVTEQVKLALLKEDNLKFLSLSNMNELLILLQGTGTLDVKSKNEIKKKIKDELDVSSNIMSYVVPQSMENLAISDLKESNNFYREYTSPEELIQLKTIFGLRPFEYDNSPKFELYKQMYKLALCHPEQLSKMDFLRIVDSLCLLEVPLEVFQMTTLEKSIEEMIENEIKEGKAFDGKLSSRMCVLYGNMGLYNVRDKWAKLCLAHFIEGANFPTNSLLDLLTSLDTEIFQHYEPEVILEIVRQIVSKLSHLSDQKKTTLAWNLERLGIEGESHDLVKQVIESINPSSLKCLDKLLLTQITSANAITDTFSKKEMRDLYLFVHHKVSPALTNDTSSVYSSLKMDLTASNQPFKENQWIAEEGLNAYTHLYVIKKRTSVHIYPNDLFLVELVLSQNTTRGFEYNVQRSDKLPPFFELNEHRLREMGITVLRHTATEARQIYIEGELENRLKRDFKQDEAIIKRPTAHQKDDLADLKTSKNTPKRSSSPRRMKSQPSE
jgi:hypothetical protein